MDPFIVFWFDFWTWNWKNGDMFKFYHHFEQVGDSGIIGAYIAAFMMFTFTIFTGFLWYRYMIGYYMNGRIIDLYRRLSGQYKAFFIPIDNEVSLNYLKWVITRAKKKENVIMSEKRTIKDKYGKDRLVNFIEIFKVENGMLKKNRLFFKDYDGSLIEVPIKKVFVKSKDLKKLMRAADDNPELESHYRDKEVEKCAVATGYAGIGEVPIKDLCKNTKNFLDFNRGGVGATNSQMQSPRGAGDDVESAF